MAPNRPPVIIIGMHRSGTSMISKMLEGLGLFVGWRKQADHEATFFLALNEWLLEQCNASWDNPEPIRYLMRNRCLRELVSDYLRLSLRSTRAISFLGVGRYLRLRSIERIREPWGWKDPRCTFTLPLWLDVFPGAKLIHVFRHGVDVASSLRVRHDRIVAKRTVHYERVKWLYLIRPKYSRFAMGARCAELEQGLALWEEYLREARAHLKCFAGSALEVKYEEFLADPQSGLRRLVGLCGLEVDEARIKEVAAAAEGARALAYRGSRELSAFAWQHRERLATYGY